MKIKGVDNQV